MFLSVNSGDQCTAYGSEALRWASLGRSGWHAQLLVMERGRVIRQAGGDDDGIIQCTRRGRR